MMREKRYTVMQSDPGLHPIFNIFNTIFVLLYAVLWSFMEIEIEGKNGWVYSTPSECSGILGFTQYHMMMNYIVIVTLTYALMPSFKVYRNMCAKTCTKEWWIFVAMTVMIYILYWNIWFIVEDTVWFYRNEITYSTAPWQTEMTKTLCAVLMGVNFFILLILFAVFRDTYRVSEPWTLLNLVIVSLVQICIIVFVLDTNYGVPFHSNFTQLTPRETYCN